MAEAPVRVNGPRLAFVFELSKKGLTPRRGSLKSPSTAADDVETKRRRGRRKKPKAAENGGFFEN